LTGIARGNALTLQPGSFDFGRISTLDRTPHVTSFTLTSGANLSGLKIAVAPVATATASGYVVQDHSCPAGAFAPGATCQIRVAAVVRGSGTVAGSLTVGATETVPSPGSYQARSSLSVTGFIPGIVGPITTPPVQPPLNPGLMAK
jgi:hypothetical protein